MALVSGVLSPIYFFTPFDHCFFSGLGIDDYGRSYFRAMAWHVVDRHRRKYQRKYIVHHRAIFWFHSHLQAGPENQNVPADRKKVSEKWISFRAGDAFNVSSL